MSESNPPLRKKKVLVSGCFDLLHSGHVEFFREAAKLGDLYVRVGSDANIRLLKQHAPMFSEKERLFMVQNIRCVHDAAVSVGKGRFDFFEDAKLVKPDIYFVNEDASELQARLDFCAERGIDVVVKPRCPADGLEARSSTSIKQCLKNIDADEKDLTDVAAFNNVFPWRFCFAGGWLDLKWCNEIHPGCVITINIKYHEAICKDQCGLATSSRKHAIKLWNGSVPTHLEAAEAAKYLFGAENFGHFAKYVGDMPSWEKQSYSAGSQDHCGLFFPGINRLNYNGTHWPESAISLCDRGDPDQEAIMAYLENVLWVVEIPFVSRPGDYNSQRVNNLTDENIPHAEKVQMVKNLAAASNLTWNGIVTQNAATIGKGLSDTMKAWEAALPYTTDPYRDGTAPEKSSQLREFCSRYDAPHTHGCLFSGAGGGFLFVINDAPVEGGVQIQINTDPICKPFPSDNLLSKAHPIPWT